MDYKILTWNCRQLYSKRGTNQTLLVLQHNSKHGNLVKTRHQFLRPRLRPHQKRPPSQGGGGANLNLTFFFFLRRGNLPKTPGAIEGCPRVVPDSYRLRPLRWPTASTYSRVPVLHLRTGSHALHSILGIGPISFLPSVCTVAVGPRPATSFLGEQ